MMMLILSGVLFTLLASSRKTKKADVEFDDLAPGLSIDLGYYLFDTTINQPNQTEFKKKKKVKKEELLALINSR